jgi:hypothetical protein
MVKKLNKKEFEDPIPLFLTTKERLENTSDEVWVKVK